MHKILAESYFVNQIVLKASRVQQYIVTLNGHRLRVWIALELPSDDAERHYHGIGLRVDVWAGLLAGGWVPIIEDYKIEVPDTRDEAYLQARMKEWMELAIAIIDGD